MAGWFLRISLGVLLLSFHPGYRSEDAHAQFLRDTPIRIILPSAPGGGADTLARGIAQRLAKIYERPVIVENVPGGTGTIALRRAILAPPDGNTIVYVSAASTANEASRPQPDIVMNRDLAAVGMISRSAFVLAVSPSLGVKTLQELIELGKIKAGGLNFASLGTGSNHHYLAEMFKSATGLQMTHIPYRGEAVAILDMMAGRVDMMFVTASVAPYVEDNRVIGLGVSSPESWPSLPSLKPLSQIGLPTLKYNGWNGLMAPRNTPPAMIAKLNEALGLAINSEELVGAFKTTGFHPVGGPPEDLTKQIDRDKDLFTRLIKEHGLVFD